MTSSRDEPVEALRFDDQAYDGGSNYATSVIGNQTVDFISGALKRNAPFFA